MKIYITAFLYRLDILSFIHSIFDKPCSYFKVYFVFGGQKTYGKIVKKSKKNLLFKKYLCFNIEISWY